MIITNSAGAPVEIIDSQEFRSSSAGLLWFLAFALFVLVYGPKLVTPSRNIRT